jgi:hypothetical protein|tara:strand:+ start:801 stop:1202 length:402 start_codon:yes stop_codon:yes gene_type:complete
MLEPCLSHDRKTLTVQIPMIFKTRGGRKLVVSPDGMPSWAEPKTRIDNTMVKALARAFRWRRLLEDGVYSGIEDLARAEKINTSYVSRILRLTLLAPDIVEMILDGRQSQSLTLKILQKSFPISWKEQSNIFL